MIGLIGLGTMGENLVRNLVSKGESIVVWNRTFEKSKTLSEELGEKVTPTKSLEEFVEKLKNPPLGTPVPPSAGLNSELGTETKNVFLLVPAGKATDDVAQELFGILSPDDAIWDLGNAHWDTTIAHQTEAKKHGIHWVGCGISGGSEGARLGPSLMPGGDEEAVKRILPTLEKIAAKDFAGKPCVTYVGREAAGNFVKMVHNGIEYAIMQGIAEIYDIIRFTNIPQNEIQEIFKELNTGLLRSFLLEITVDILGVKDPLNGNEDLLPKISDIAGSKGTGGWTVEAALKLGVSVPSIAESLFARWLSGRKEKANLPKNNPEFFPLDKGEEGVNLTPSNEGGKFKWRGQGGFHDTQILKQALKIAYMASYFQGIELILAAEKEWNWGIDIHEVLRIWQGGCIIRSEMLRALPDFFKIGAPVDTVSSDIAGLLMDAKEVLDSSVTPTAVLASSYHYILTSTSKTLPTNLIQAMRDSFGSHGVKRVGSDKSESFRWK